MTSPSPAEQVAAGAEICARGACSCAQRGVGPAQPRHSLAYAVLLLLVLGGVLGCGESELERVSGTPGAVPEWARVSTRQLMEARRLGVQVAFENSTGLRFVLVPGGNFRFCLPADDNVGLRAQVSVISSFYMSVREISASDLELGGWRALTAIGRDQRTGPAVMITAGEAIGFVEWMNSREPGRNYRLPDHDEWLYSAVDGLGWADCGGEVQTGGLRGTAESGANEFGCIGLLDGIREWCLDPFDPGYYVRKQEAQPNACAAFRSSAGVRVLCDHGSGWAWALEYQSEPGDLRGNVDPTYRSIELGFRVVVDVGN